jgi:hypothetical protein
MFMVKKKMTDHYGDDDYNCNDDYENEDDDES